MSYIEIWDFSHIVQPYQEVKWLEKAITHLQPWSLLLSGKSRVFIGEHPTINALLSTHRGATHCEFVDQLFSQRNAIVRRMHSKTLFTVCACLWWSMVQSYRMPIIAIWVKDRHAILPALLDDSLIFNWRYPGLALLHTRHKCGSHTAKGHPHISANLCHKDANYSA